MQGGEEIGEAFLCLKLQQTLLTKSYRTICTKQIYQTKIKHNFTNRLVNIKSILQYRFRITRIW